MALQRAMASLLLISALAWEVNAIQQVTFGVDADVVINSHGALHPIPTHDAAGNDLTRWMASPASSQWSSMPAKQLHEMLEGIPSFQPPRQRLIRYEVSAGGTQSLEESPEDSTSNLVAEQQARLDVWRQTAGKSPLNSSITVLVTGGAGYIGSHMALGLLDLGVRVVVVDDLSRGHEETIDTLKQQAPANKFKFYDLDIGNSARLNKVLTDEHIDAVMHFAGVAYAGESAEDPLRYYDNNTVNTILLAKAMKKHDIRTLIYSSSCATYGTPAKMPVTEETAQNPVSPYGLSKLESEQVLRDLNIAEDKSETPFKVAFLRYFNVIGADPMGRVGERRPNDWKPGSKEYKLQVRLATALFDAAQGIVPKFTIAGDRYSTPDGTALRDYVHVTDLARAHISTLASLMNDRSLPTLRYYNVGTGKAHSVKELVSTVKAVTGVNFSVVVGDARSTDPPKVWADNAKIHKEVGWQPQYNNLTECMEHAWAFRHKENPSIAQVSGDVASFWGEGNEMTLVFDEGGSSVAKLQRSKENPSREQVSDDAAWSPWSTSTASPKVFVYDISGPCSDQSLLDQGGAFGSAVDASEWLRNTDQHATSQILHHRLANSKYRTKNPDEADLFYVPVLTKIKDFNDWPSACSRCTESALAQQLGHLNAKTASKHVLVVSFEHFGAAACKGWWSSPTERFKNVIRLAYSPVLPGDMKNEGNNFNKHPNDWFNAAMYPHLHAIPWASSVHWSQGYAQPSLGADARTSLMRFSGGDSHGDTPVRQMIHKQCQGYKDQKICHYEGFTPAVTPHKMQATFCLEPGGDTPFRRSLTDSIALGCIPVLFSRATALTSDILWKDWRDATTVQVPRDKFIKGEIDLKKLLTSISADKITGMQQTLLKNSHKFQLALDEETPDLVSTLLTGLVALR